MQFPFFLKQAVSISLYFFPHQHGHWAAIFILKAVGCRDFQSGLWTQTGLGLKPSPAKSCVIENMLFTTICKIGMTIHQLFEGMNANCLTHVGVLSMLFPFPLLKKNLVSPQFTPALHFSPWLFPNALTMGEGWHP